MVRKTRQLNNIQFGSFSSTVGSDAVKLVAEMLKVFVEGKANFTYAVIYSTV